MSQYLKNVCVCFIFVSVILIGRPASAQINYPEGTFKESLVQLLFQYGREVYARGVDPQEAAFVFQRILVLDCHHSGAQDFLDKIHDKYPNIAIKINNCSQSGQTTSIRQSQGINGNVPSSSFENYTSVHSKAVSALTDSPMALPPDNLITVTKSQSDNSETPVMAYSEPILKGIQTPDGGTGPIVPFPIMGSQQTQEAQLHVTTGELPSSYVSGLVADCDQLRLSNMKLEDEIAWLKTQIKTKDGVIINYKKQIATYKDSDGAFDTTITQDQKDLTRIQQSNIDYLQNELAQAKEQMVASTFKTGPTYDVMRREIASSQLLAKEKEIDLETKNREAQLLQKQLGELQEQLRLVKRILSEKNDIIKSLEEELETVKADNN